MLITPQLKNIKDFEAVGFTHEQAEILAEVQESTATAHDESLKEYLGHKFEALETKFTAIETKFTVIETKFTVIETKFEALETKFEAIETKIGASEQRLKTEIAKSSSDLLIKIFGIIVGSISIAVAVLKLFP